MSHRSTIAAAITAITVSLSLASTSQMSIGDTPILGLSPDAVIKKLGEPSSVSAGAQHLSFVYTRANDATKSNYTVTFHDGQAIFRSSGIAGAIRAQPAKGSTYLGQAIQPALKLLGTPKSTLAGTSSLRLVFENREVMVAQGRVVGIRKT